MTGDIEFTDPHVEVGYIVGGPDRAVSEYTLVFEGYTLTITRCGESGWVEMTLHQEGWAQGEYFTMPMAFVEAMTRLDLAAMVAAKREESKD